MERQRQRPELRRHAERVPRHRQPPQRLADRPRARSAAQNFTGIDGINAQDRAVQESMGEIVDRSREHLGPADRAIIAARRLLSEAVQGEAGGHDAARRRHELLQHPRQREGLLQGHPLARRAAAGDVPAAERPCRGNRGGLTPTRAACWRWPRPPPAPSAWPRRCAGRRWWRRRWCRSRSRCRR